MKMFKTDREYIKEVYEVVSYNFPVGVDCYSGDKAEEVVSNIISLLEGKELKSLIKDVNKLYKRYKNSFEYENGMYVIWNDYIEDKI